MKILIPTAKEMNEKTSPIRAESKQELIRPIIQTLAAKSPEDLATYYHIKPERAEEEARRWQDLARDCATLYPAWNLFDGLMYRQMKRQQLSTEEEAYLEHHVRITSALYGVVPVMHPMAPHRLDFMGKLLVEGQTLKNWWRPHFDAALEPEELVISLLSSEFEAVFSPAIRERMIRLVFTEEKDGQRKIHSTISKKARGKFLSAMVAAQVKTIEEIQALDVAGFRYDSEASTMKEFVFVHSI